MADNSRPGRSGDRRSDGQGRSSGGRSERGDNRPDRRDGKPAGRGRTDSRAGGRDGSKPGARPARKDDWRRPPGEQLSRTEEQERYDGPPIPEEITGKELDRSVTAQLKGLPEKLAARVARHLAAAGMLIDEDPKTAYQHTLAARARAAKVCW